MVSKTFLFVYNVNDLVKRSLGKRNGTFFTINVHALEIHWISIFGNIMCFFNANAKTERF